VTKYKGEKGYRYSFRAIAFFVLISFTLLNIFNTNFSYAQPVSTAISSPNLNFKEALGTLKIPDNIGTIQELFIPPTAAPDETVVVYIQNAHSNIDSERNTQNLIAYFQREFHLPLVLLEGGEGKLDNLFFKSFPSKELKEKLMNSYLAKGDLSGGETAAILFDDDTQYFGIENQALYDQNKKAFLETLKKQSEISQRLVEIQETLDQKAAVSLNDTAQKFRSKAREFQKEDIDLIKQMSGIILTLNKFMLTRSKVPPYKLEEIKKPKKNKS